MSSSEHIRHFIRHILGCGCPEEVFRTIDVHRNVRQNNFVVLKCVIIIGNRLLVYIAEAGSSECIEEHLPVLVPAGQKERDEKRLNRFRLVLVADQPKALQDTAERLFEELRGADDKVHLHVVSRKEVPFATENLALTEGE